MERCGSRPRRANMEQEGVLMIYRGYKIIKAPHPIRMQPSRMTYDVMRGAEVLKANFASIDCAKFFIDTMVRVGVWPDLGKEQET